MAASSSSGSRRPRRRGRSSLCAGAATLILAASATAQEPRARILGRIVDAVGDVPVADATVRLVEAQRVTRSTEEGYFSFDAVPLGTYTVSVEHIGFRAVQDTLRASEPGATYDLLIRVAAAAIPLAPMEVTVRDERGAFTDVRDRIRRMRALGLGRTFERDEIERSGAHRLTHLIARMPGVRTRPIRNRAGATTLRLRTDADCAPSLYMDGLLISGAGDAIDDMVGIDQVEFVEIYRRMSELPGEFADAHALRCGAVAVWTRRGTDAEGGPLGWRRVIAAGALAALALFLLR